MVYFTVFNFFFELENIYMYLRFLLELFEGS